MPIGSELNIRPTFNPSGASGFEGLRDELPKISKRIKNSEFARAVDKAKKRARKTGRATLLEVPTDVFGNLNGPTAEQVINANNAIEQSATLTIRDGLSAAKARALANLSGVNPADPKVSDMRKAILEEYMGEVAELSQSTPESAAPLVQADIQIGAFEIQKNINRSNVSEAIEQARASERNHIVALQQGIENDAANGNSQAVMDQLKELAEIAEQAKEGGNFELQFSASQTYAANLERLREARVTEVAANLLGASDTEAAEIFTDFLETYDVYQFGSRQLAFAQFWKVQRTNIIDATATRMPPPTSGVYRNGDEAEKAAREYAPKKVENFLKHNPVIARYVSESDKRRLIQDAVVEASEYAKQVYGVRGTTSADEKRLFRNEIRQANDQDILDFLDDTGSLDPGANFAPINALDERTEYQDAFARASDDAAGLAAIDAVTFRHLNADTISIEHANARFANFSGTEKKTLVTEFIRSYEIKRAQADERVLTVNNMVAAGGGFFDLGISQSVGSRGLPIMVLSETGREMKEKKPNAFFSTLGANLTENIGLDNLKALVKDLSKTDEMSAIMTEYRAWALGNNDEIGIALFGADMKATTNNAGLSFGIPPLAGDNLKLLNHPNFVKVRTQAQAALATQLSAAGVKGSPTAPFDAYVRALAPWLASKLGNLDNLTDENLATAFADPNEMQWDFGNGLQTINDMAANNKLYRVSDNDETPYEEVVGNPFVVDAEAAARGFQFAVSPQDRNIRSEIPVLFSFRDKNGVKHNALASSQFVGVDGAKYVITTEPR